MPMPFGSGGGGGLGAMGGLIFGVSLLLSMRRQPPGPIGRLIQSGAVDPEHARRPSTVGIRRPLELKPAIRKGLVVELGDGRCWVDQPKVRRRRIRIAIVAAVAAAVVLEAAFLFLRMAKAI